MADVDLTFVAEAVERIGRGPEAVIPITHPQTYRLRFADEKKLSVKVTELVEPRLLSPQADVLNEFIDSFFDDAAKKKILRRTGNL